MKLIENVRWIGSQLLERANMLRGSLVVFMYHRVAERDDHPFLQKAGVPYVSPQVFREQLHFLADRGFRVLSFRDALEGLEAGRAFPPRSALITFDDGYRDNLVVAAPVLAELGFPATIFVATRVLWRSELLWEHRVLWALDSLPPAQLEELLRDDFPLGGRAPGPWLVLDSRGPDLAARRRLGERLGQAIAEAGIDEPQLARELYLSAEELRTLPDQGIEIGSHGAEHHQWTALSAREKANDLTEADEVLRDALETEPLPVFCSPYGSHRRGDRALLRERGFRAATSVRFGTNRRRTDRFLLRRVSLGDESWHRLHFLDRCASLAARFDGGH